MEFNWIESKILKDVTVIIFGENLTASDWHTLIVLFPNRYPAQDYNSHGISNFLGYMVKVDLLSLLYLTELFLEVGYHCFFSRCQSP